MKKRQKLLMGVGLIIGALYIGNASWMVGPPEGEMSILSHRGVHQTYHRRDLNNETCTAERIDPPTHAFLENTLDSMMAAISAGAHIIELDIHPTTDGEFVVFHDFTLDCRTEGTGRTRDHDLTYLKSLDIGYGYTADGGETFPFRGKFVGDMPTLSEVLAAFPVTHFMINFKSRSKTEAARLLDYVPESEWKRLIVSGHIAPTHIVTESPAGKQYNVKAMTRQNAKACLKGYLIWGWSGHVPKPCHNSYVPVPANLRRLAWGWPHRFERRLNAVGSRSVMFGDLGKHLSGGIDTDRDIARVPKNYRGIVYTNKVEVVGPALRSGQSSE